MTKLTVDPTLRDRLQSLDGPVELCDDSGRVLGRFVPVDDMSDVVDLSKWEPAGPDIREEELDKREQATEWYTTQEVLDHLRNLEKQ